MACGEHRDHEAGCEPCRRYARSYFGHRQLAIANGTWQYPRPVAEVRRHLRKLRASGMHNKAISAASGVSADTIYTILNPGARGARKTVQGPTAVALLAVTPLRTPPSHLLDPTATARKIQAMVWLGHGYAEQFRQSGVGTTTLRMIANGRQPWVTRTVARAVDQMYARLSLFRSTARNARQIRKLATDNGWDGPLAWESIADPACRPERRTTAPAPAKTHVAWSAVLSAVDGAGTADELTVAERVEVVTILARRGWSDEQIGAWLRWGPGPSQQRDNVHKFRQRHEIPAARILDRPPVMAAA